MEPLRRCLPQEFLRRLQAELGREEALRLLWPAVVGPQVAANTRLKGFQRGIWRVAVPDRTWRGSLASMDNMILEAIHRFWGEEIGHAIEFVEDPQGTVPGPESPRQRRPAAKQMPRANVSAEPMVNGQIRGKFLESAGKHFAWQQERKR